MKRDNNQIFGFLIELLSNLCLFIIVIIEAVSNIKKIHPGNSSCSAPLINCEPKVPGLMGDGKRLKPSEYNQLFILGRLCIIIPIPLLPNILIVSKYGRYITVLITKSVNRTKEFLLKASPLLIKIDFLLNRK